MSSSTSALGAHYTPASLKHMFVIQPNLGGESSEQDALIAFYPNDTSLDQQLACSGLAQAFTGFTAGFVQKQDGCEDMENTVFCEKQVFVVRRIEENVLICMIVASPFNTVQKKNAEHEIEYMPNDLCERSLQAMLSDCYKLFTLFHGRNLSGDVSGAHRKNIQEFRDRIELAKKHWNRFLNFYANMLKIDQVSEFSGFKYFPVDRITYLNLLSLSRMIKNSVSGIDSVSFIYDHKLMHTELDYEIIKFIYDMEKEPGRPMFTYLAVSESEEDVNLKELFLQDVKLQKENISRDSSVPLKGKYLTGPFRYGIAAKKSPCIFIPKAGSTSCKRLVAYQKGALVMICTMPEEPTDNTFYKILEDFCSPNFDNLNRNLSVQSSRPDQEDPLRFLYFNRVNLALKHSYKPRSPSLSNEVIKIMQSIHKDFQLSDHKVTDVFIKTRGEGWVIGHNGVETQREYFIMLEDALTEFADVYDVVSAFRRTFFSDISIS